MIQYRNKSCYKCKDRHQGCHSKCEKYARDVREYEAVKQEINRQKMQDRLYVQYAAERKKK